MENHTLLPWPYMLLFLYMNIMLYHITLIVFKNMPFNFTRTYVMSIPTVAFNFLQVRMTGSRRNFTVESQDLLFLIFMELRKAYDNLDRGILLMNF